MSAKTIADRAAAVLAELEALGTAQNLKIYRRHGAIGPCFGVSFANIDKLARRLKTDHPLAAALWNSGNVDAQALASKIADPAALRSAEADRWLKACPSRGNHGLLARLIARGPHAQSKARTWSRRKDELTASAGYDVLAALALEEQAPDAAFFLEELERIEREIATAKNRVRYSMNNALIAIGGRSEALRDRALAAADRIGAVEVDHGDTSCKTPAARPYIEKMWARKAARAKNKRAPAAKKRARASAAKKKATREARSE